MDEQGTEGDTKSKSSLVKQSHGGGAENTLYDWPHGLAARKSG